MMLILIDTSKWDPIVDWQNYTWDGAFIKVSEGMVEDRIYKSQWGRAKGFTIRGPYHFFRVYVNPTEAAQKFVYLLGNDQGELPPVLDLEDANGYPNDVPSRALKWLETTRKAVGRPPIVYTSQGFANYVKLYNYPDFKEYPLWLAAYPRDKIIEGWTEQQRRNWIYTTLRAPQAFIWPRTISPWSKVTVIQWTAKCPPEYVPGYPLGFKDAVDINFYAGTMYDLFNEFDITYVPNPKGDDDMTDVPITLTALLRELQPSNLRRGAGLDEPVIETLTGPLTIKGVGVKILKDNYWWIQIVEPKQGFVALTTSYSNVVYNPNPNPNPNVPRKVIRSVLYFDDGTSAELAPVPE